MTKLVTELDRSELKELKQSYLIRLADEGVFAEIMGVDYDEPSWHDLAHADDIVPDDVVFREWDGVYFEHDDFECNYFEAPDMTPEESFLEFQSNEAESNYFNY